MLSFLVAIFMQGNLPSDAQQISKKADDRIETLRKAFEKACTEIKIQELRELTRVYEAIKKSDQAGAAAVKEKMDALQADANVAAKGSPTVIQWLQGKWIFSGVVDKNFGEVWEFKGDKVIGTGIGDRVAGTLKLDGGKIQVVWNSGLVEFLRVPDTMGDEVAGVCRTGEMKGKRMK
jgi:hypothetical protein